ncbi:MFS transporter [bacterium]|nr:MAG: MFS transporter [bacterium]
MLLFHKPKHIFHFFIHRKVDEIYYSVGLRRFAAQLIGLYEPIFLYLFFDKDLSKTLFFFAAIMGLYILFVPLGGRMMARFGIKHNMIFSIPTLVGYYLCLFLLDKIFWLIFLAPIFAALTRAFFLPAFHADFANLSKEGKRGKQLGILQTITILSAVTGPLLGAFILDKFSFSVLFVVITIIFFLSAIPLMLTYEAKSRYHDSYKEAWKRALSKRWRKKALSLTFYGFDSGININIWPLFLFSLGIQFGKMGLITSVSLIFSLATTLFIAHLADNKKRIKLFRIGCFMASAGNIAKAFVRTALSAFSVQSFFLIGDTLDTLPLTAHIYDKTQKEKINIGRFIMFREITQNLGTFLIYLFFGIFFLFSDKIFIVFPVAAISLLLAGILSRSFEKGFIENIETFKKELGEKIILNPEGDEKE